MGKRRKKGMGPHMKKDNSDTYTRRAIRGLFLLCLWVLWLLLPMSVCRAEGKVVRVGSFEDTFNYIDKNGVRRGYGYELMQKIARKHGMVCLLHEKPFAGVNGSGKHNNWSISTDTGENLLEPGSTPNDNLQFLLVLSCIIKAVDRHADLLRMSSACVGNDLRLGADEAPPAIISIFLGDQLQDVVEQIVEHGTAAACIAGSQLDTGVSTLPLIRQDATDRNRTSPFAFTGNKFEFRMVGSSDCIANANTVINTIMAEAFSEAADVLEQSADVTAAANRLVAENLREHSRVIFNGNGYSGTWVQEAARRGLPNLPSMVSAVPSLTTEKAVKLFGTFGVFTEAELHSRSEIMYETYAKVTGIEARTMVHMAAKHYIPAIVRYTARLGDSICKVRTACPAASTRVQERLLQETSELLTAASDALQQLEQDMQRANEIESVQMLACFSHDTVTAVVQIKGKVRAKLEVPVDIDPADLEKQALAAVADRLGGKEPRKVIVKAPKIVSIVPAE